MELKKTIKGRRSIRSFKNKKINKKIIENILEAANQAPSAGNLQALEIVVINDKKSKERIARAAYGQEFIAKAPILLIFLADPKRSARKYGQRGRDLYCIQDATIAAAYAQLAAFAQSLGSAWVGALDEKIIKEILEAPSHLKPVSVIPVGYPDEEPEKTDRRNLEDIVHWKKY